MDVMNDSRTLILSDRDAAIIIAALDAPPRVIPALVDAARRLRARDYYVVPPERLRLPRQCNGRKRGTTPSSEGTAQPCEHAYWDPGPWDVGKGFGQWRFPCQQVIRP